MLNQFRSLYPQGSIQTELITINHGKYIVRVVIQVENIILASSLAAAETVETAEEQARNRALALLNLEDDSLSNSNNKKEIAVSKKSYSSSRNRKKENNNLEIKNELTTGEMLSTDSEPILIVENKENQELEINHPNPKSQEEYLDIKTEKPEEPEELEELEELEQLEKTETPENSDDFSDLVAKTNLELKRLGWTNEQGRDYLLQTYGKRSRQLLNHEELREFLHYLEQQ